VFTVNLLLGLLLSQLVPEWLAIDASALGTWKAVVKFCTMWCLAYIMVHVGYEFDIDKSNLGLYAKDYAIGMTAAGLPWISVAAWFIWALPTPLGWKEALVAARFAAPTSAGILFAMLEASGLKETWLFRKARILAIFDDLDTILLMVPLKVIVVGLRWELSIDLGVVVVCFALIWCLLHRVNLPCSWPATMIYATLVAVVSEAAHFLTHDERIDPHDIIETVHLEVLLPAFTIGCIVHAAHVSQEPDARHAVGHPQRLTKPKTTFLRALSRTRESRDPRPRARAHGSYESEVNDVISSVFMLLVGLSMPSLFSTDAPAAHRMLAAANSSLAHGSGGEPSEPMGAGLLVLHVVVVSVLMVLGKMFPVFCYRDEATLATRFALSLGMCPRGEVGAGVIVISLTFGIGGDAITIAVICLALNLVASSLFIMGVKRLAKTPTAPPPARDAAAASRVGQHHAQTQPQLPPLLHAKRDAEAGLVVI